jgi:ribonuclease HI
VSNGEDTSKEGVGFIINKDLLKNKSWKHTILIPGRASRLEIEWVEGNGLDMIVSYAPNSPKDKILYFKRLEAEIKLIDDWKKPMILGDFNFVEDAIDRIPHREDNKEVVDTFKKLKKKMKWVDGKRVIMPETKEYTFLQPGTLSTSRIDRIYTHVDMLEYSHLWGVYSSGTLSDHNIASIEILKEGLPYLGTGMWRINETTLNYKPFKDGARKILKEVESKLENYKLKEKDQTPEERKNYNPQKLWLEAKFDIKELARWEAAMRKNEIDRKWTVLNYERMGSTQKLNEKNLSEEKRLREQANLMKTEIELKLLEDEKNGKLQAKAKARYKAEGETNSKYWFNLNKEHHPKTIIYGLFDEKEKLKTETKEMTKIASAYHRNLQKKPEHNEEREEAIKEMVDLVENELNENQKQTLEQLTTYEEVAEALKKSENGKSPGHDGLSYEFYKHWPIPKDDEKRKTNPDIVNILTMVIQDIERNGVEDKEYTRGVMSLIYKKKDKLRIENYRPVTLMNTDYKLQTKAYASKIGKVASTLLHENQAGFVPGRGLYDHTRNTHTIIEYCELKKMNGCIVSLDQEKAYDKIDHDYMWRILRKNGFPEPFLQRIQYLYGQTETTIMVNGVLPKPIEVRRGVRQGCPMSCLLYNIAIEPLAIAIRKSTLKGIEIPGMTERLIVTLFADDTLVYLRDSDDQKKLTDIIDRFCKASTAKFNLEKTEYLPIGEEEYRKTVIATRKIGNNEPLPENITIIREGEQMRTLGAWVGNGTTAYPQWNKILEKQQKTIETWGQMHLSYKGKELVAKALIQSRAIFLATVNGMPKSTMMQMQKQLKDFIWDQKARGLMKWEEIIMDRNAGGLGIPDIKSRTEAIQIMWLKKWLSPKETRPAWAYLTDEILNHNVAEKPMVQEKSKIGWITQSWHESMSKKSKISKRIRDMLKVARKYNIMIDSPKMAPQIKEKMPIWHHFAAKDNWTWNKKASQCLRDNHNIRTIKDLTEFIADPGRTPDCQHPQKCGRIANTLIEKIPEKYNPNLNTPHHDNLDHTPRRLRRNANKDITKTSVEFNPDITERTSIENAVRIFSKEKTYKTRRQKTKPEISKPAYRKIRRKNPKEELTLYTDGSSNKNGSANSKTGAGVWHKKNSSLNQSIKISGRTQTNQRAELIAIIIALKKKRSHKIKIRSDSKTCLEGIIRNLKSWEDKDFLEIANEEEWRYLAYLLRRRKATTKFKWIKGHEGEEGNEEADRLANEGAQKETYTELNFGVPKAFQVNGARLQSLTQAQAYRLVIRNNKSTPGGKSGTTQINIEDAQEEIMRATGLMPTEKAIWEKLTKKPIKNKIADFIWRLIHNRLKCGSFFQYIKDLQDRQYCPCGEVETPEHILLHCEKYNPHKLWAEIGDIWKQTSDLEWIPPSKGIIMGLGAIKLEKDNRQRPQETKRYKTFVSKGIWTIWKKRNRRIFDKIEYSENHLIEEWKKAMNEEIETEFNIIALHPFTERKTRYEAFKQLWCTRNDTLARITETNPPRLELQII